jgi:C1A family cysteine protease
MKGCSVAQGRVYGWHPDIPDARDFLYSAIKPAVKVPGFVDLRIYCSAVEDQGRLGSCTAQALCGNLEFLDNKPDQKYQDVSRLFIYYNERALEGSTDYDAGASLRDGIKSLKNDGVCSEALWPYDTKRFAQKPPQRCYTEAKKHTITSYHRISTLSEMLACLAEGYPFVFGFTVYESFQSAQVARSGVANMPQKKERAVGGHAVMAVGFDKTAKRLIVRNSWGTSWGQKGYFTLPFEYAETLAADFWTIRK